MAIQTIIELRKQIIEVLKTIIDPEIPVNIWDLGLVYGVEVDKDLNSKVIMTLTSRACPAIDFLPQQIEEEVETKLEITSCQVVLVWEPKWSPKLLSEVLQIQLGLI
jgi:metal-sulfur cluster biosynthetic enzyme